MTSEELQAKVDAAAALIEQRYQRLQALMDLFEEPIRRADAMARPESWLATHPPRRAAPG